MTPRIKSEIERNPVQTIGVIIACVVSVCSPLVVLWKTGVWVGGFEQRIASNEREHRQHVEIVSQHIADEIKHIPNEKLVSRVEWAEWRKESDRQRDELRTSITRIEDRTEKIYELLSSRSQKP
jgi:hypothetical protein